MNLGFRGSPKRPVLEYGFNTWAITTVLSALHGLNEYPSSVDVYLENVVAIDGYSVGDRIKLTTNTNATNGLDLTIGVDTQRVYVIIGAAPAILSKLAGAVVGVSSANWRFLVRVTP